MIAVALLVMGAYATAQIPVEVFAGHERATIDVLFFKFFKNKEDRNTPWLFFNRNRAAVDYRITSAAFLPQFGFTEAVSYNHPRLKGFAPVAVGQVLSWGAFAKAGVQYAHIAKHYTLFSWAVVELRDSPGIDYFLLARYTPRLTDGLDLFSQLEFVNTLPTDALNNFSFVQRLRLGLKAGDWQFGAGADFSHIGRRDYFASRNVGAFLRHEF
ncbi:MAG: hypothetical protein KF852_09175 [Saprospiraceae bacterium]|nr:hypothetical protein [Saprospiraceae bacterium]